MPEENKNNIRQATAEDLEIICKIEKACFPGLTAYPKSQLAYLILNANSSTLVETENKVISGFIIVTYRKGSQIGSIETIDVEPNHQKQGVGLRLLEAAESDMKKHKAKFSQLQVSIGNQAALNLYKKAGYTTKQKLVGYYQFEHNGSYDAYRMVKALDGAP